MQSWTAPVSWHTVQVEIQDQLQELVQRMNLKRPYAGNPQKHGNNGKTNDEELVTKLTGFKKRSA